MQIEKHLPKNEISTGYTGFKLAENMPIGLASQPKQKQEKKFIFHRNMI